MIDRLSPRAAAALAAVGILLLSLIGWFALVSPQRSHAAALDRQIAAAQTQLTLAHVIERDSKRQTTTKHVLRRLAAAMPDEVRMSEILRQLASAAAAAPVRVNGVTPQAPTPLAGYQAIPLTVTVEGHYFGLAKFLRLLRAAVDAKGDAVAASGRLFNVQQIRFAEGAENALIQATLTLEAYSYGGVAAPTAGTPAQTTTTSSDDALAAPAPAAPVN